MKDEHSIAEEPASSCEGSYTYSDYMKFDFDYMVELIRGKIFKMSPAPSTKHQQAVGNLHLDFGNFLRDEDCMVFIAPFDVILPVQNPKNRSRNNTVVQPDLCVVCNTKMLSEANCFGAPDLLIEAISPHTKKKDIRLKYEVYEEAGVKEYWVVYPLDKVLEIFILEDGKYKCLGRFIEGDMVNPTILPDLKIDLEKVFNY